MKKENISPLLYYTKKQAEKLSSYIKKENTVIDFATKDSDLIFSEAFKQ